MCWHVDKLKRPPASFVLSRLYQANPGSTLQPLIRSASRSSIITLLHALSSGEDSLSLYHEQEAQDFLDALDQVGEVLRSRFASLSLFRL
jgi:hypothetical protein